MITSMKLLFLDTETTAKENGRLVQLAYKSSEKAERTNLLFKPPMPIDYEAMAVHHITNEQVAEMPVFDEPYRSELQEIINQHIVVAHNAEFDIQVLAREGVQVPKYICTLKAARRLFDFSTYKLQFLRYRLGLEVAEVRAHDAEGDIEVLEALFSYLVQVMERENSEITMDQILDAMQQWTKEPSLLKTINFGKHKGRTFEDLAKYNSDYLLWLRNQPDVDEDIAYTINHHMNAK